MSGAVPRRPPGSVTVVGASLAGLPTAEAHRGAVRVRPVDGGHRPVGLMKAGYEQMSRGGPAVDAPERWYTERWHTER